MEQILFIPEVKGVTSGMNITYWPIVYSEIYAALSLFIGKDYEH